MRAILAALSARKGDSARVLYTADQRALENDEIFVEFITGSHDAFVIEDADHLLMPRANGNVDLHRFLAIADGVVRAQRRQTGRRRAGCRAPPFRPEVNHGNV